MPPGTPNPNLRTTQVVSAAEAVVTTLDTYNVSEHDDDGNTVEEIDEKEVDEARSDVITAVIVSSNGSESERVRCDAGRSH